MENEERDRLLTELSGPAYDPGLDRDELLHELFEAVVDAGPDRPAIQLEGRILSYRQLDAQANRLAHALRQRDIGPDDMKIGRRCYIDSSWYTEFDCIRLGDEAALNEDANLQTHLFEDRVMKVDGVTVGKRCTVGLKTTVLYGTALGDDAALGDLSLLMPPRRPARCWPRAADVATAPIRRSTPRITAGPISISRNPSWPGSGRPIFWPGSMGTRVTGTPMVRSHDFHISTRMP